MATRDPDDACVVLFTHKAFENPAKSLAEGRRIFDDIEVCEIRFAGAKDWSCFPATALSTQWIRDPFTGEEKQITYAERFPRQYQQFKARMAQTKSGTPLDFAVFLTEGQRASLRAQNIYTVEQLALVEGQELKNLGPGGRDFKNSAAEFMADSKAGAPNLQMASELEALRARNIVLEEDARLRAARAAEAKSAESDFDDMTTDQLREYITTHTGNAPVGNNLNHKALKRLAIEARPSKAA